MATTSRERPWVIVDLDLQEVDAAKLRYPRYVPNDPTYTTNGWSHHRVSRR